MRQLLPSLSVCSDFYSFVFAEQDRASHHRLISDGQMNSRKAITLLSLGLSRDSDTGNLCGELRNVGLLFDLPCTSVFTGRASETSVAFYSQPFSLALI